MPKVHLMNFMTPPSGEISPFLLADNQLQICNGVDLNVKKGQITKDLGYSKVGSTLEANKAVTSLHNFRQSASIQKILATINNTAGTDLTLQYNNAGTWTVINTGTTWNAYEDAKVEMEDFIGYCFFVGYDSTDNVWLPVASLTGTTFSTSTNVTSMPQAKYIKRYRDRLYLGNCYYSAAAYPYRVYFSSVPSAGSITWTPASDFIDVDFSEQITGLGENWDRLMVFTEFSAYMYDQDTKKKVWDIGCINGRTIQNYGPYMIWANKYNVWASTSGRPTPIGGDIAEFIKNSTPSRWQAAVVDDNYYLYLGATESNGRAYTNCMAIFNMELGFWRIRELYDNVTSLARYTSGSDDRLYMGVADGMVHDKCKRKDATLVYTDDTKPILAHFRTKAYDFGDPSIDKTIKKIVAYAEYAQGLTLRFRIFNKNQEAVMPFVDIGKLEQVINEFDRKITGNFIQFEGKEYSGRQAFKFYGLSVEVIGDSNL